MTYILLTKDGKYVVQSQMLGHIRDRLRLSLTDNLHEATVFHAPISQVFKNSEGSIKLTDVIQLRAKEIRRVEIIGDFNK